MSSKRMRHIVLLALLLLPSAAFAQESADPPTAAETPIVIHTVESGDTLFGLAERYATTVRELANRNNLSADSPLFIGQKVIISGVPLLPDGVQRVTNPALLDLPDLPPVPKIYLVQGGDSITSIAAAHGMTTDELLRVNQLAETAVLYIGQPLQIPNQVGDLYKVPYTVKIGDSLTTIAAAFNTRPEFVSANNRLINDERLIAGEQLTVVSRTGSAEPLPLTGFSYTVQANDTLTAIAAQFNRSPSRIAAINQLPYPTPVFVGQQLRIPSEKPFHALPAELSLLELSPQTLRQGEAFTFYVELTKPAQLTGNIQISDLSAPAQPYFYRDYEQRFPFTPFGDGYLAIVGLDAFTRQGLYTLELLADDESQPLLSQLVYVAGIDYGLQSIALEDDGEVRSAENFALTPIYKNITPEPLWDLSKPFASPLEIDYRTAIYGSARSYADAPVSVFHSGVDFGAPVNTPVRAVADGLIVYSELTQLRGNLVIIDHGLGVFTSYAHMNQRLVAVGDRVTRGEAVGSLGNTGLSTGAHLHWEVRVRDVAVNGAAWFERAVLPTAMSSP